VVRDSRWQLVWRGLIVLTLIVSFLTALSGLQDAWRVVQPIIRL
jgi:hypothetical protein